MDNSSVAHLVMWIFIAGFLPALIALIRRHHNAMAIIVLTALCFVGTVASFGLALPLTGIGWIIALIWSFTAVAPKWPEPRQSAFKRLQKI
jgi:hypothetical protein